MCSASGANRDVRYGAKSGQCSPPAALFRRLTWRIKRSIDSRDGPGLGRRSDTTATRRQGGRRGSSSVATISQRPSGSKCTAKLVGNLRNTYRYPAYPLFLDRQDKTRKKDKTGPGSARLRRLPKKTSARLRRSLPWGCGGWVIGKAGSRWVIFPSPGSPGSSRLAPVPPGRGS